MGKWLRVKTVKTKNGSEADYYFWNPSTNETTWDEPKLWKEYRSDIGVEFATTSTTEYTVSDLDYRQTAQLQCFDVNTAPENEEDATMELLKLTSGMSELGKKKKQSRESSINSNKALSDSENENHKKYKSRNESNEKDRDWNKGRVRRDRDSERLRERERMRDRDRERDRVRRNRPYRDRRRSYR